MDGNTNTLIGKAIKRLRQDQRMTAEDLGAKLGVTRSTVHRWEAGERNPSDADKEKICHIFGITIAELFSIRDAPLEEIPVDIGLRMKEARQEAGLSLRAVAEKTKMVASFLSDIERGKAQPSISTLWKIARAFGTTPSVLLAENPVIQPEQSMRKIGGEPVPWSEKMKFNNGSLEISFSEGCTQEKLLEALPLINFIFRGSAVTGVFVAQESKKEAQP